MISSLKSRFDISNKRAVVLTSDKATVHHWQQRTLSDSFVFEANDAGLAYFSRYLDETPNHPVYFLVDIVEEEFRIETVPHVIGRDRSTMLKRRTERLFRNTPYFQYQVQGREAEGRKDDQVLFSALTNPDLLQPWMELMQQHKTPVAGIYSLAYISKLLLSHLNIKSQNTLLVTLGSNSGLRQSFFRGQQPKISRLALMPRLGTVPYAPYLLGELEKIRRYLNSLRLISRDAPLDVYILSSGKLMEDLIKQCRDTDDIKHHIIDVAEVARALDIKGVLTTPYSDYVFAHLLLESAPRNLYATRAETNYYKHYQARIGMLAASLLMLLGSVVWSGFNFIEGVSFSQQSLAAEQKANFYEARFEIAKERLPQTPVEPMEIAQAVEIADTLKYYKANPITMMQAVSRALEAYPSLHIDGMQWISSVDPNAAPDAKEHHEATEFVVAPDAQYRYYQVAMISGHVAPFTGNYREAIAEVNDFAETLRNGASVYRVHIEALPIDVSSEARLEGSGLPQTFGEAQFAIRVIIGISDGAS